MNFKPVKEERISRSLFWNPSATFT